MKIYSPKDNNKYRIIPNPSVKDIISLVQPGDVLAYTTHTQTIYDVEKDKSGNVIDGIILHQVKGIGGSYVKTKIGTQALEINGSTFYFYLSYLFLNHKLNTNFEEGLDEGGLGLVRLSTQNSWININNTEKRSPEYTILRFIQKDSKGNAILNYNSQYANDIIKLSDKNNDRRKFKHLFIEKLVNINNNNIVELGDILIYKIIIKNLSKNKYNNKLFVTENLSKFVTYETHYENKDNIIFEYDIKNKILKWNIGQLDKNEEIIIHYLVKVTNGKPKGIIESTGFVGNIPSSIIKNVIGINLNKNKMNLIIKNYEKLKDKYNGKKLINEIYKNSFNVDIKFDDFDITKLVINKNKTLLSSNSIYLNKDNTFYNAVLNKYYSSMAEFKYEYVK